MSMQIHAQYYTIYFDRTSYDTDPGYNIITIAPDGTTETEFWGNVHTVSDINLDPDVTEFYQKVHEYVNPLLEQGYRFINPFTGSYGENGGAPVGSSEYVFFLAIP
tara:strand:- start:154 stop:471 length:318 start_codon:yes stop_codon:yes gene_type:complete